MNTSRTTIVLLILVILAALWTSGRLTVLINTITGKEAVTGGRVTKKEGRSAK